MLGGCGTAIGAADGAWPVSWKEGRKAALAGRMRAVLVKCEHHTMRAKNPHVGVVVSDLVV